MMNGRFSKLTLWTASAFALAATATPAWAENELVQPSAEGEQPTELDQAAAQSEPASTQGNTDILVTAQRRTQTLVEIPQSVSVLGGETLERQNARSFLDYVQLVPGFSLTQENPGESRLILRGVNTGGISLTVATYVDDTPFGASGSLSNSAVLAGDFDTFDVARVEVLRGPQGTLYGTNALGGVVKFITALPNTERFEFRAQAGIEDTHNGELGYTANALVNVPLGDTLAFRASGFFRRNGGFVDAPARGGTNVNRSDSYGARASLLFTPTDNFSIRLFALVQNIDTDSPSSFAGNPTTLRPVNPITLAPVSDADRQRFERIAEFNRIDYRVYAGTIDYDFGFARLTSVTSYAEQTRDELADESETEAFRGLANLLYATTAPNTVGTAFESDVFVEKFTQEVRLQSPDSDRFEWLIGGYYTDENTALIQEVLPFTLATRTFIAPATTVPAFFGPPFAGNVITNFVTARVEATYEEIAAFASATLKFGDRFDITVGGRYSHNSQTATQGVIQLGVGAPVSGSSSEGVFTWSVSPRFELNDLTSVYGRVAKGYRPGGPNYVPPGAPADFPREFNSDSLISYELGFRTQTDDRVFSFDGSVFYLDWSNILIQSSTQVNGTPVGVNSNGRGARSLGAEATIGLRPTQGLNLTLTAAYTDAELTDPTIPPSGGANVAGGLAGDRLPNTPQFSGNLAADYEWSLGNDAQAFVGANVRIVGDQYAGFNPTYRATFGRRLLLEGYTTVDLRAGVNFGNVSVQAFARNLFDTYGVIGAGFPSSIQPALGGTSLQYASVSTIRPRTIGLTVGFQY